MISLKVLVVMAEYLAKINIFFDIKFKMSIKVVVHTGCHVAIRAYHRFENLYNPSSIIFKIYENIKKINDLQFLSRNNNKRLGQTDVKALHKLNGLPCIFFCISKPRYTCNE